MMSGFAAVFHCIKAQAGTVDMRVLRAFVGRHLCKFVGELHIASLFNFRFPQCLSLRDVSDTRSTCRLITLITSIRAYLGGPPRSTTSNSASCLPFVGIVFGLGQFGDVRGGVTEGTAIGSTNAYPKTRIAFAPNWWRNEGIWHGQQAF